MGIFNGKPHRHICTLFIDTLSICTIVDSFEMKFPQCFKYTYNVKSMAFSKQTIPIYLYLMNSYMQWHCQTQFENKISTRLSILKWEFLLSTWTLSCRWNWNFSLSSSIFCSRLNEFLISLAEQFKASDKFPSQYIHIAHSQVWVLSTQYQ